MTDQQALDAVVQQAVFAEVEKQRNYALNEVANLRGENAALRRQLSMQAEQTKQLQISLVSLQESVTKSQGA